MLKKILSGFIGAAVIFTSISIPAFAAKTSVLNLPSLVAEDGTPLLGVTVTHGAGGEKDVPNGNAVVYQSAQAATEVKFKEVSSSGPMSPEVQGPYYWTNIKLYYTGIEIPFTIPKGTEHFEIAFDTYAADGGGVSWQDYGSVYTTAYQSQCDRDQTNAIAVAGMGHDWGTSAGTYSNSRDAIGADAKGSATLTKAAVGFQPDGQWITTKWAFDLNSEKVSYTFGERSGDVYMMRALNEDAEGNMSGKIVFSGYTVQKTDQSVLIKNLQVNTITDSSKVPVYHHFDSETSVDDLDIQIGKGVAGKNPCINEVSVKDDEKNAANKALKMTFTPMAVGDGAEAWQTSWAQIQRNYNTQLKIPYSGLKEDENLKVSFKTRMDAGESTILWPDFATIMNANNERMVYGRRSYNGQTHDLWGTYGDRSGVTFIGANRTGMAFGDVASASTDISAATKSVADGEWHAVTLLIQRDGVFQTFIDGKKTGENQYIFGTLTDSGYLWFEGYYNYYANIELPATSHWLDDVKIEAWKPLTVTSNLGENFDAAEDILLTFSQDVGSEAMDIRKNICIKQNGETIPQSRIIVSMDDAKTARVKVTGGLKYNVNVEFSLAAGLLDANDIPMAEDYTRSFKTRLSKSLFATVNSSSSVSGSVTANVTVTNPTGSSAPAYVALAVYNSANKMIGIAVKEFSAVSANNGTETCDLTASVPEGETPAEALVMLWDTRANLNAYHMAIDVPLH